MLELQEESGTPGILVQMRLCVLWETQVCGRAQLRFQLQSLAIGEVGQREPVGEKPEDLQVLNQMRRLHEV